VLRQNPDADILGCNTNGKGENDRCLTASDTKTRSLKSGTHCQIELRLIQITFPTDAKLLHAAIKGLNRLAHKCGLQLRQSYLRIAKRAAMMAGRYAHAKQFQRHHRQLRLLRTRLGRLIRDIRRKIAGHADLELLLSRAS
jgi:transposase, IS5 family